MKIQRNCLVEIAYRIAEPEGEVLESSEEEGLMTVRIGGEDLPPALENALEGKQVGDEVKVSLAPGEAFGEYNPDGVVAIAKADFPEEVSMEPGELICVEVHEDEDGEEGEEITMRVLEVQEDSVILDANHPLADRALEFWVRVETVRPS